MQETRNTLNTQSSVLVYKCKGEGREKEGLGHQQDSREGLDQGKQTGVVEGGPTPRDTGCGKQLTNQLLTQ